MLTSENIAVPGMSVDSLLKKPTKIDFRLTEINLHYYFFVLS